MHPKEAPASLLPYVCFCNHAYLLIGWDTYYFVGAIFLAFFLKAWLKHGIALFSNSDCGSLCYTSVLGQDKEGITFVIKTFMHIMLRHSRI